MQGSHLLKYSMKLFQLYLLHLLQALVFQVGSTPNMRLEFTTLKIKSLTLLTEPASHSPLTSILNLK